MGIIEIFQEFVNKFLGQAPLLMGTIVLIGYLLLGKKWYNALGGFIKAYVGFKILQVGTGGLVRTFKPIIEALTAKFGLTAYVIDPYFGQTSAQEVLTSVNSLTFIGYVNNNVNINDAENAIWEEIEIVKSYPCCSYELQKIKNKVEASLIFSKTNFLNNAMNLAQFELLGNANDINTELDKYNKVSSDDIMQYAKKILVKENSTTLHYLSKQKQ